MSADHSHREHGAERSSLSHIVDSREGNILGRKEAHERGNARYSRSNIINSVDDCGLPDFTCVVESVIENSR